jgi:hypothetical protein
MLIFAPVSMFIDYKLFLPFQIYFILVNAVEEFCGISVQQFLSFLLPVDCAVKCFNLQSPLLL